MRLLVLLLALVIGASPALAQQPRGRGAPAPVDRREAIKKKIRALRAYTLTEELKLDDKTAAQLFPVLAKWDDVTDRLLVTRTDLTRQLSEVDDKKDTRVVNKLVDDMVANQKAFWDLEDKRLAELRKILTPAQTARVIIVLPAFERRIQRQLRNAIQNRGRGAASQDPFDDGDGDDDDGDDNTDRRGGDRRGGDRRGNRRGGDRRGGDRPAGDLSNPFAGPGSGNMAPKPRAPPKCDPFSSSQPACLE